MSFGKFVRREGDDSAEELRALLPGKGFGRAIDILEKIASKTEDKQMYDQREKALRDYEWALSGALSEGREEGREEGKIEGYEVGKLACEIQVLQKLLGEAVSTDGELFPLSLHSLSEQRDELQSRMRNR
jgi:hypothetical protein